MIQDFACDETEKIWHGHSSRRFPSDIQNTARRKLRYIHFATDLNDLRQPPGNRLEALKGNRKGQQSIRINSQWRICFEWDGGEAYEVEIVDYH